MAQFCSTVQDQCESLRVDGCVDATGLHDPEGITGHLGFHMMNLKGVMRQREAMRH